MTVREITVNKPDGLNPDNALLTAKLANMFKSSIMIRIGSVLHDVKSMTELVSLDVKCGDTLLFEAQGKDERKALAVLAYYLAK